MVLRKVAAALIAVALMGGVGVRGAAATATGFSDDFDRFATGQVWRDGGTYGGWRSIYDGYGRNGIVGGDTKTLELKPKASTTAGETHGGLVTSTATFGDIDFTVRLKTVKQLRTPTPTRGRRRGSHGTTATTSTSTTSR